MRPFTLVAIIVLVVALLVAAILLFTVGRGDPGPVIPSPLGLSTRWSGGG